MNEESASSKSAPTDLSPALRVAVTAIVPVTVLIAQDIVLPGLDREELPRDGPAANVGIFTLGITPFVSAMLVVELLALLRPAWSTLRHGGPAGRRKLTRAAAFGGILLALFQAFGIARLLESVGFGVGQKTQVVATLVAGSVCQVFLAELVSAYGLASGLGILLVVLPIVSVFRQTRRGLVGARPVDIAVTAAAAVLTVIITTCALYARPLRAPPAPGEATYREPAPPRTDLALALPVPASGIGPIAGAFALLTLPVTLGLQSRALTHVLDDDTIFVALALALVTAGGALGAWLFNQPARVAAVAERARAHGGSRSDLLSEARAALRRASVQTLVLLVALLALGTIAHRASRLPFEASYVAYATAVALDLVAEWRARRALPNLVAVWPEHRPYAVAAAREALVVANIPVHARGEHLRRLLQFLGPFVPIDLMVPRADAARASDILATVLGAEAEPARGRASSPAPRDTKLPPIGARPILALALLSAATVAAPIAARRSPPKHAGPRTTTLELLAVDDEYAIASPEERGRLTDEVLPKGVSLQLEDAPLGAGRSEPRVFARIVPFEGEALEAARARLLAWAATRPVPEGDRVAVGDVEEYDEEKERFAHVGFRTYLLTGPAVVTADDIVDASARPASSPVEGATVFVQLGEAGSARFASYTGDHTRRRLAVVVDGSVMHAPVILGRIPGGRVTISMGAGDPDAQLAAAKRLAAGLLGR
jgi:hypothetical protein